MVNVDSPRNTLKIRWELHKLGTYFLATYKGSVLAKNLFATIYNGRQNKFYLTLTDQVGHLAPSALLYHCNKKGKCKTRLVHGFQFQKVTAG